MKPVEVKSSTYFDSTKENYEKYRKFKIALYRKKGYTPDWFRKVFAIKKLRILSHGHILLVILIDKKLLEHSTKKNCKKEIKKNLELKN